MANRYIKKMFNTTSHQGNAESFNLLCQLLWWHNKTLFFLITLEFLKEKVSSESPVIVFFWSALKESLDKSEEALKETEMSFVPSASIHIPNYPWHMGHRILDGGLFWFNQPVCGILATEWFRFYLNNVESQVRNYFLLMLI